MSELIQFEGRTVAVIAPEDLEALEKEVEALKQLWFSDADPAETRYASEFAAMKEQPNG